MRPRRVGASGSLPRLRNRSATAADGRNFRIDSVGADISTAISPIISFADLRLPKFRGNGTFPVRAFPTIGRRAKLNAHCALL